MAFNQLKGAAGVELQTIDLSENFVSVDEGFKVGLVGWTAKGPSNKVITVDSTDKLNYWFGTPSKKPEQNQMLYAARMILETGATVKIVRYVGTDESLGNASVILNSAYSADSYAPFFGTGGSYPITGNTVDAVTGSPTGVIDTYEVANDYTGVSYTSLKFDSVIGEDPTYNYIPQDNLKLEVSSDTHSPFTIWLKYPGFSSYYFSFQTYANYGSGLDTFNSKISEDVEFATYVKQQGFYDPTLDTYNLDGNFYRNGEINTELTDFINIFGVLRIYASKTSSALYTIPFTRDYYVSTSNIQLRLNEATLGNEIVIGKVNDAFNGLVNASTLWKNRVPYSISQTVRPGVYNYTINRYEIKTTGAISTTATTSYDKPWKLFEDISLVEVDMLCAAGTTVNGFGTLSEAINDTAIAAMLTTCTRRKDCFAIIDLPKRRSVSELIELTNQWVPGVGLESGGSSATYETFWGAMYDGRDLLFDKYNRRDVEVAKTAFVAQNIANVRLTSVPWQIVAGTNRGAIISAGPINPRKYPDEVGELTLARINSCRNTIDGQFLYAETTLQRKNSALNRLHVVSLLADLYKRYRRILSRFVFELNTPELRRTIASILNEDLKYIKTYKPAGIYEGVAICDNTNNTPATIDANKLIVDIKIEPTKGTEQIILRTTILRTNGIEMGLV